LRRLLNERLEKKAFKMSVILPLLDLDPASRSRAIDELVKKEFKIPYSSKRSVTRATIYRWIREYAASPDRGTALVPKLRRDRGTYRVLSESQRNALLRWRYDNEYRTVEKLREELLIHATTNKDPVPSERTIARFLRDAGLDRKTLCRERAVENDSPKQYKSVRLAFEAPYPQRIWMGDTKGPRPWVKDPRNPDNLIKPKLIVFLDDYSRFITGARYFLGETEENVMTVFRSAITAYGVPDILYVDLGPPYAGHSLLRAAALVGCRVLHTPKADPEAKGKVERAMRFFKERLESELALLTTPPTLEKANEYLAAVVSRDYHVHVHSATGQTPYQRMASFPADYRRFVSAKTLALIFLPCKTARVSKTCLIRLNRLQYLVADPGLCGQKVDVRYDHLDPGKVFVFFQDEFRGEACVYTATTDFLDRQADLEKMQSFPDTEPKPAIPPAEAVPPYSYLERMLAEFRLKKDLDPQINDELYALKAKKEAVKAALMPKSGSGTQRVDVAGTVFGPQEFAHLLAVLLRRKLASDERLKAAVLWQHYGPLDESLVRATMGKLLGEGQPAGEISAFLDAIRIAACSASGRKDVKGGQKEDDHC